MFGKKKASVVTEVYDNEKERDKGVKEMAKQGYAVQSMTLEQGNFKKGKAAALGLGGAALLGPVGIAAGALAGRKDTKWHVVFRLEDK